MEWSWYHSLVSHSLFSFFLLLALSPLPSSCLYLSSIQQHQVLFEHRVLRRCQPRLHTAGVSLCRGGRLSCVWSSCSQPPQADLIRWPDIEVCVSRTSEGEREEEENRKDKDERERARYHTAWPEVPARAREEASRYLLCSLPCSWGHPGLFWGNARTE